MEEEDTQVQGVCKPVLNLLPGVQSRCHESQDSLKKKTTKNQNVFFFKKLKYNIQKSAEISNI